MEKEAKFEFIEVQNDNIYEIVSQENVIDEESVYMLCEDNELQPDEHHQLKESVVYVTEDEVLIEEEESIESYNNNDDTEAESCKQTTSNHHLTCDICDREFITVTERNEHIEDHFLTVECPHCLRTFVGDRAFNHHTSTGKCKEFVVSDRFKCDLCNEKMFDSKDAYNKHVSAKHKCVISEDRIDCTQCNRTFAKLKYLRKHIREVHEKATPFHCKTCGKKFNRKANLIEHELIHDNKYLAVCKTCNKSYRTPSALKLHERTHTGEKPYVCKICNEKSYAYNSDLKRHQRAVHKIVDGDKTYPCTHDGCNKVFYEPKLLRNHASRSHKYVNDWLYCQFCPLSFAINEEFELHTYSHFKSRTCSGCNVRLFQICNDWYEIHTTANCKNNNHIHSFGTNNAADDGITIKQEPIAEMETVELDELLDVKTDVDFNDFGEVFATSLNTTLEIAENNLNTANVPQQMAYSQQFSKPQLKFRVVNIKMKETVETEKTKRTRGIKCRFCDKVLQTRFWLDNHIQSYHSVDNETKCKHCNQKFQSFQQLDKHLKRCAGNNRKRIFKRFIHPHRPKENFQCDLCGNVLKKFRTLEDHMKEVHSNECSFECRICGRFYPSRYYLSKHLLRHKQGKASDTENVDLDTDLMERRKYTRVHPHRPKSNFTCDICNKKISRFDILEEHMSNNHSARDSFRCRICGRCYPSRYYLQKHIGRHKNGSQHQPADEDFDKGLMERNKYHRHDPNQRTQDLTCDECGKVFKHHNMLMEHKTARHSAEATFLCRKCNRFYPNRYYLAKHMKRHEELEKNCISIDQFEGDLDEDLVARNKYLRPDPNETKSSYDCDECGLTFTKFHKLTEHIRSKHSDDNGYRCTKCGRCFPNRYYLTKHKKIHENNTRSINVTDDESNEQRPYTINQPHQRNSTFVCNTCGMIYPKYELLQEHISSNHTSLESFMCGVCNRSYPNRHDLVKHMKRHQSDTKVEEKIANVVEENLVKRHKYFRAHPHRPVSNFECDICKKVLSSFYSMEDHMKSKHSKKSKTRYPCSKCKKDFMTKKRLKQHETLKHSTVKPEVVKPKVETKHMCSICGRLFPERSKMIMHEKTHSGTTISCETCGKEFLYKHYLQKHIKNVHSKVKNLACGIDGCEWKFAYQQCLIRHRARRHGIVKNRNACPICSKEFPESKYHLQRHLKAHANNTAKEYIPEPKDESSSK
ncbi:zinc finger protein 91-like [Contarinia nasturtii]|uniref:zinc finger protein 91-like n=1 Tax=Contarinia nasturtii TaxID=265458 RepID=UPI0012D3B3A0|nr:zinc finger protein 91-like [Contarinia nasturtii]